MLLQKDVNFSHHVMMPQEMGISSMKKCYANWKDCLLFSQFLFSGLSQNAANFLTLHAISLDPVPMTVRRSPSHTGLCIGDSSVGAGLPWPLPLLEWPPVLKSFSSGHFSVPPSRPMGTHGANREGRLCGSSSCLPDYFS